MGLKDRVLRALARDKGLSLSHKLEKAYSAGRAFLLAPVFLRECDRVGPGARARGEPLVENQGRIEIGRDFHVNCAFERVSLHTARGARLSIGDDAFINFGVTISADERVALGHRVTMGPYARVCDHDDDPSARRPEPIVIGDDVWLAARVRVNKGVTIGAGTVVAAGSVVDLDLPENVIASGAPARVIRPRPAAAGSPKGHEDGAESLAHAMAHRATRAASLALSRARLSRVTSLGKGARVLGEPYVENRGRIDVGDDFVLASHPRQSHIVASPGARIRIGHRVTVGSGAAISSDASIEIGDDVRIGRNVMVLDTDFHDVADMHARGEARPVVIESGARLDDDVIVLKGSRIERGAWVAAGSVVSGVIPAGAFAAGVRAHVVPLAPEHVEPASD